MRCRRSRPGHGQEMCASLKILVRRLLVLRSEDAISGEAVEAEFKAASGEATREIETESLAASVEQHIRRYFEALEWRVAGTRGCMAVSCARLSIR